MPTTPTPAFRLGEKTDDPLQMYLADVFTVSANLAGCRPSAFLAVSQPDRLPIGLQLTGRMFDEATLLRAADAFQRDTDYHHRRPRPKLMTKAYGCRCCQAAARRLAGQRPEQQAKQDERNRRNQQADDGGDERNTTEHRQAPAAESAPRRGQGPCRRRRRPGRPAARPA